MKKSSDEEEGGVPAEASKLALTLLDLQHWPGAGAVIPSPQVT